MFEVIGSQFKQQDKEIVVVARLLSKVAAPVAQPLLANKVEEEAPPAPAVMPGDSEVKQVVTTKAEEEKPKKRKLRQTAGNEEVNELTFKIGDA